MNAPAQTAGKFQTLDACKVVILYDGPEARDQAMRLCNRLTLQFDGDIDFNFKWWRMDFLKEAGLADLSAEEAGLANILIICANPAGRLAGHIKKWFGSWASGRSEQLGVLVDLTRTTAGEWSAVQATKQFLREVARRAGFDYLETSSVAVENLIHPTGPIHEQTATSFPIPEYLLADEESPAPEHYGLNE
jgi:hypothetical protein